jgi:hypothetical protein
LKKSCAIQLLIAGLLAGSLIPIAGQSPPTPPGLTAPAPVIQFGAPPITVIGEHQVFEHVANFQLPEGYVVRSAVANMPAARWNATVGARLKTIPVSMAHAVFKGTSIVQNFGDASLTNATQTNCVAIFIDLGGVEQFEIAENGEVEMVWVGEAVFAHFNQLAKNHGAGPADQWKIRYTNQRAQYAMDNKRIAAMRGWIHEGKQL